jgi:lysozyme family protein
MSSFIPAYRTMKKRINGLALRSFSEGGLGAVFLPAYEVIKSNECSATTCYVNDPNDSGGETYAGISRVYHPNWDGWVLIDFAKNQGKLYQVKNGTYPGLEGKVKEFYSHMWSSKRFGEINSQELANIFFDFYVWRPAAATSTLQQTLNQLGYAVAVDGLFGPQTLNAINSANSTALYNAYRENRLSYLDSFSLSRYYQGWVARASAFPAYLKDKIMNNPEGVGLTVTAAIVGVGLLYYFNQKKKKTTKKS